MHFLHRLPSCSRPRLYNPPGMPTLFVVATPIGNLEDVTLRALRVLREVSLIAAEDTRTTRKLLAHHSIRNRLLSYNDHNKAARIPRLLHALREGDVALVSEGGTPVISDPGLDLVAAALDGGFAVTPVPGPSAVTAALAVSGLASRQFPYLGFPPPPRAAPPAAPRPPPRRELARRKRAGEPAKRAVPEVAARYGLPRRQAYRLWLEGAPRRPSAPEQ